MNRFCSPGNALCLTASASQVSPDTVAAGLDTVAAFGPNRVAGCALVTNWARSSGPVTWRNAKGKPTLSTLPALAFWRVLSSWSRTYAMFAMFCLCQVIFWKSGGVFTILAQLCDVFCSSWFGRL